MKKMRKSIYALVTIMISLTLVTTSVVCGLFARYISTSSSADGARVALMASDVKLRLESVVPTSPGEEKVIPLTLTNYHDDMICEVNQRYRMTVEYISEAFVPNIPLQYAVYTNESCTEPAGGLNVTAGEETFAGAEGEFKAGVKEEPDEYWIKVTWPSDKNDASYALEVDALEVRILVEQID